MEWLIILGAGLAFFALIMVSVALHEIGHMVPAKLFGVRVPMYFVGFGPTMWSTQRGETRYGIKWFPLGGFVRLLGMYPPGSARHGKPSRLSQLIDSARSYEWEEITAEDVANERLFYQKRTWQKLIVMFGGPAMNLLIAFGLFWGITAGYGVTRAQPVVAVVQECIIAADANRTECTAEDPLTPAAKAGMLAGDTIVSFNEVAISSYDQLTGLIRANLDNQARIVVEREGRQVALTPVTTVITGVADTWDPSRRVAAGFLGVQPQQALVKGGPVDALQDMATLTGQSVVALAQFPVKVWNVAVDLVTGQPRDVYGPVSIVGASRVAGEVIAADGIDASAKLVVFASLLASVNLFLAVFNLVPLPPLDGGHMAGAVWEWLRRMGARVLKRPDPGPFDTAKLLPLAYLMWALLLGSGVLLILADIISPLQLF